MEKGVFSRDAVLVLAGFTGSLGGSSLLMWTIVGITNLVSIGFRIISGPVADRIAKKNLSLWGALMMCAGCTACALTQGTGLLLATRIVHGIGFACCSALQDTISAWQEPPSSWPEDSASSAPNPRPRQWQ